MKKPVVLFTVFLCLILALTACSKHSRYGAVIVDSRGMEHVIMTDANGVTVLDDKGNLVEIITDSANKKPIEAPTENGTRSDRQEGEYQTMPITFPGVLEDKGGKVEDAYCTIVLPDGWEQIGDGRLILHHKATDAQVSIFGDIGGSVSENVSEIQNGVEIIEQKADMIHEEDTAVIDGYNAVRCHNEIANIARDTYIFATNRDIVCKVTCTAEKDKFDAAGFNEVLSALHFK